MTRWLGSIVALALLAGCGEDISPPLTTTLASGDTEVTLSDEPRLTLSRLGSPLLDFGPAAFQLGILSEPRDANFDPYRLVVPHPVYIVPDDLRFLTPESATLGDGSIELVFPEGVTATVAVTDNGDGRFIAQYSSSDPRVGFMRLIPTIDASEGVYGLGEHFDQVDNRGTVRAMQIEADPDIESLYNEAHVPVPLAIGTRGWGLFVESPYPGAFEVATQSPDNMAVTFGTGQAAAEGLPVHLFTAAHPLDVTRHYYDITGYPGLPARWGLGPVVWRDENDDQAQVEGDLDAIRDLDLATTGYWIDRPYATAVNSFDFLPSQFPDPPAMYAKMEALGFKTALWHTPYLDDDHEATAGLIAEADAAGYYPPQSDLFLNGWGKPIDVTNPETIAWWRELLGDYVALGVEGFKLDYGEDILNGLFFDRVPWEFDNGDDELTMHSQFTRYYHEIYAALLPAEGGFLLCRAGTYGDQTNGVIIWPGDLDATFAVHREPATDANGDPYVSVGGLPASIVAGLSLGPSGYPFYGADTGGYRHSPTDKELFMRWFEQTALSTVMQIGTSANDVAWELGGENGFDQEMLDSYRFYTRLHLRLWPYLWSHAQRLALDGRPIQRALGLAYPELGVHPNDTYLLGDDLLVAPVVERGKTDKLVMFPPGRWVHWLTGESYEGPGEEVVAAPLGRLPLFLREDGLIPLLRPTIDTLNPTDDPDRVDSYATDPGLLYVRGVAGGSGSFALFDGGEVSQTSSDATSTLAVVAGDELAGGTVFELMAAAAPAGVSGDAATNVSSLAELDAASEGWFHSGDTLYVKLPPGDGSAEVSW